MYFNKIGRIFFITACLIVLIPFTSLGVPVPSVESYTQSEWKNAWEDAWKIAWESAWKSVNTASLPAETVAITDAAAWDASPVLDGEFKIITFNVVWGAPLQNANENAQRTGGIAPGASQQTDGPNAVDADYGKLFIQAQPADAAIAIRGVESSFTQGMSLTPGAYIVDISRSGYLTQTRRIELLSGMAATMDIALTPDTPMEETGQNGQTPETATQAQLFKSLLAPAEHTPENDAPPFTVTAESAVSPVTDLPQAVRQSPGALYVSTVPADAKVRILHIKPVFHQGIELAPGRYTIDAARDGFERSVAKVEITPDKDTSIRLTLKKALPKAKLFVKTEPAGATVRILNIKPVFHQGIELKQGEYRLDAQLDGYGHITRTIQLLPGEEKSVTLSLPKTPAMGKLYVDAAPAGARIRILDIKPKFEQGMRLKQGEYTIDAQLDGYRTEVRKVRIASGEDTKISLQLAKAADTGKLFVETEPAGAMIRILDIKPKFEQGMELNQGEYTIDAQLDGYTTEVQKVRIIPGRDNNIRLSLASAQEKGKLFVDTEPHGAKIRILSIKPVFHQGIELAPGSYTVDARLDGHDTAVEQVTIVPGKETRISLALHQSPVIEPAAAAPAQETPSVELLAADAVPKAESLPQKTVADYDVEAFVSMAVLAINAGNYDDAIKAGDKALRLNPNCAEALKIKGDAYLLMEAYDNAIREYDKALALSNDQQIRINKAYAFEQLEKEIKLLNAAKAAKPAKRNQQHQFAFGN